MNPVPWRFGAAIVLLGLPVLGVSAAAPAAKKPPSVDEQLTALLKLAAPVPSPWAEVTDPFKSDQRKADWPSFVVPKGLRDLLQGEAIVAGEATCRFRREDERPGWEWQLSLDIKGAGDHEVENALKNRLLDRAKRAGFKVVEMSMEALPQPASHVAGAERTVLRRASDSAEEIVAFTPMWSAPPGNDGSTDICWIVRSMATSSAPTYAQLVRALPCMEVRHDGKIPIPDSILRLLRSRQVNQASIDGNGRFWYGLHLLVVIDPKDEKGPASLESKLVAQLTSEGLVKQRSTNAKARELDFFKATPATGEYSCQATLKPHEDELSVWLTVQLEEKREARQDE
jgi:hypothetical protein